MGIICFERNTSPNYWRSRPAVEMRFFPSLGLLDGGTRHDRRARFLRHHVTLTQAVPCLPRIATTSARLQCGRLSESADLMSQTLSRRERAHAGPSDIARASDTRRVHGGQQLVQRPLRRLLLPTHPYLRGGHRQAHVTAASRQAALRRRGGADPETRHRPHPPQLATGRDHRRGDGHYATPEAVEFLERQGCGYIFGLSGNARLNRIGQPWSRTPPCAGRGRERIRCAASSTPATRPKAGHATLGHRPRGSYRQGL